MDKKTAEKNLQAARERLAKNGDTTETDSYLKANRAVIDAEKDAKAAGVPWWKR
ncbi:hypothetical protein DFP74_5768 [Nocardiopsis sp. Huas11]|uniref:hypothetical protein n=1 Tax=Nocardiopsis sp. Huas11 TaxID=2183912 RepID=UPI000F17D01C|nr:hypothetical protein [Nocardiopsis sp. Huas11]RKS10022.1 hypothetical protein DFP74_5768 [Nocardiopsis sp. Huas11]